MGYYPDVRRLERSGVDAFGTFSQQGFRWAPQVSRTLRPAVSASQLLDHACRMIDRAPVGSSLKKLSHFLYGSEQVFSETKASIDKAFSQNAFKGICYAIAKTMGLLLSALLNLISYGACFFGSMLVSTVIGLALFILLPLNIYLMAKKKGTKKVLKLGQEQYQVYHGFFSYLTSAIVKGCTGSASQRRSAEKGLKARMKVIASIGAHLGTGVGNPLFSLVHAIRQHIDRKVYG